MTTVGEYTVTGKREYRGHAPGETFQAFIPLGPEQRAIARGDIVLHRRIEPTLPPNRGLPEGWVDTANNEEPAGSSLVRGG